MSALGKYITIIIVDDVLRFPKNGIVYWPTTKHSEDLILISSPPS